VLADPDERASGLGATTQDCEKDMDYRAEMGYRTLPPHDYLTQDLANGNVRLFALEEVVNEENPKDRYDNLRAVATLDWAHGLELCDFLDDLFWEIDQEVERLDVAQGPGGSRRASADRPSVELRKRAIRALLRPGKDRPMLDTVIGFSRTLPRAVATAVFAELERLGIDVALLEQTTAGPQAGSSD
jgi:hypothetical protein